MRNEKGEVVTAVMVLMMVGMMIFGGMTLMHGDHGRHHSDQHTKEHQQEHSQTGHQHMNGSDAEKAPESGESGK